ncbi:MAG: glycoside hydrolase [Ignavibacteria bacterium RBG_16_34_14]|nr:MAG: glycoside hydrolase [Ignavibacteria bacterium RBG_16_34_14]
MINKTLYISFSLLFLFAACKDASSNPQAPDSTQWILVWSDEFDYTGSPDSTKWGYDIGGNGWGNNELQYYTSELLNARVEDGIMIIEARRHEGQQPEYSSARVVSRGKEDWTYGRFEVRAKLPSGRGTWPAIWMLPTEWTYGNGGWPDNGEIDIMEHVGFDPGVVHASTHTNEYNWPNNTQKTSIINIPDAQTNFHSYILEWSPDKMEIYVDSIKYFTNENEGTGWQSWPFDKDFHFIMNIAIGGNWGGQQGIDNSIFPQKMEIDFVRVYKKK